MGSPEIDRSAHELGHAVVRINWPEYFKGKDKRPEDVHRLNEKILRTFATFEPHIVFMQLHGGGIVLPKVAHEMRSRGAFVVNWCGDVRDPLPKCYPDLAPYVTTTCFTNHADVVAMQHMGHDCRYLQIGYDETIFRPDGPKEVDAPKVVFMGSNYRGRFPLSQNRADIVKAMFDAFGLNFGLFGRGWGYEGVRMLDQMAEARMYRGSQVAIHADHFKRSGFFSDRWLRARACGCYTVDVTAMEPQEAVKAVRAALALKDRKEQALAVAAQVREHETWHDRINTLVRWAVDGMTSNVDPYGYSIH